jgi:hypothetical protein
MSRRGVAEWAAIESILLRGHHKGGGHKSQDSRLEALRQVQGEPALHHDGARRSRVPFDCQLHKK